MSAPRVRFAPSPTGFLHVGGARTALFNWLFARRHGGTFILRIEDTDRARSSDEMTRAILDGLSWLGLDPDEGPYHQADGLERHRRDATRLLKQAAAYRCFCLPADPNARREAALTAGDVTCAGGCRDAPARASDDRAAAGEPFALRFRVPAGTTSWVDAVHGEVSFDNAHIEDFALLRSDGSPVYNLAVVSDDLEMRITHVLRGDDHLSNTPKQILIYQALGGELPTFGHLPMILGADGKRLSKRHGAVSVEAYRERGILPEAMVNFLALLGWSPGDDREVMTRAELVESFGLDRVLKKSAVFDAEKLEWLNGQHISRAEPERLADAVAAALVRRGAVDPGTFATAGGTLAADGGTLAADAGPERERLARVIEAVRERARTLDALADQAAPFFTERVDYREDAVARFWKRPAEAARVLRALAERLGDVDPWEPAMLEEALRGQAAELGVGAGKLIHPLRVALLGEAVSPEIFTVLTLTGRERTLRRIATALGYLDAKAGAEA